MDGLLTLTGVLGCLYAVYWIGRLWFEYLQGKAAMQPDARRALAAENGRNTAIVVGAFVVTYLVSSLWAGFTYFLYIAATIFLIWRLKEDVPAWYAAYKRRKAAELAYLNDPINKARFALDRMQQRDPFVLQSSVHGSARFAWVQHLYRQPRDLFVDTTIAESELPAGDDTPYPWYGYSLGSMVVPDWQDSDIPLYLRFAGEGHRLIVGPPGAGKFHSGLAPLLLDSRTSGSSMLIIDPKDGELTIKTAGRRSQGSSIVTIDPYGITGMKQFRFNPFDLLSVDDDHIIQKAEDIREALLIPSPNSKDGDFWDIQARRWLDAMIVHVATCQRETKRTLMRMAEIAETFIPLEVLAAMECNPAGDGIVQRYAETVKSLKMGKDAQRWNDICLTVQKSLFWLNNPQLRKSLEVSDFDVGDLMYGRRQSGTIYVALPEKTRSTAMAWLRVLYASIVDRLKDQPPSAQRHAHVVLDEFANLGKMERVKSDLATTRGRYWHYHLAVQSLAQLRDIYGDGWEQLLGQCAVEQVLGCGDNFTAEYYSKAIGQTTKVYRTRSDSTSSGTSSHQGQRGSTSSTSVSYNQNIQGVPLIGGSELRGLGEDRQLILTSGTPVCLGFKLNVYEMTDTSLLLGLPVNGASYYLKSDSTGTISVTVALPSPSDYKMDAPNTRGL